MYHPMLHEDERDNRILMLIVRYWIFKSTVLNYHQNHHSQISLFTVGCIDSTRGLVLYYAVPCHVTWGWDGYANSHVFNCYQEYSFTYPTFILGVHVSSFLNKAFHCVVTAFASCNMQGSPLIGESNKNQWKSLWFEIDWLSHTLVNESHCNSRLIFT